MHPRVSKLPSPAQHHENQQPPAIASQAGQHDTASMPLSGLPTRALSLTKYSTPPARPLQTNEFDERLHALADDAAVFESRPAEYSGGCKQGGAGAADDRMFGSVEDDD